MTPAEMKAHGIPDTDKMGYPNAEIFTDVSLAELIGARALAKDAEFQWDVVALDPRVGGARFLRAAKVVLNPSIVE